MSKNLTLAPKTFTVTVVPTPRAGARKQTCRAARPERIDVQVTWNKFSGSLLWQTMHLMFGLRPRCALARPMVLRRGRHHPGDPDTVA